MQAKEIKTDVKVLIHQEGDVVITGKILRDAKIKVLNGTLTIYGPIPDGVIIEQEKRYNRKRKDSDIPEVEFGIHLLGAVLNNVSIRSNGNIIIDGSIGVGSKILAHKDIMCQDVGYQSVIESKRGTIKAKNLGQSVIMNAKINIHAITVGANSTLGAGGDITLHTINKGCTITAGKIVRYQNIEVDNTTVTDEDSRYNSQSPLLASIKHNQTSKCCGCSIL